jgi:hypothetical protein
LDREYFLLRVAARKVDRTYHHAGEDESEWDEGEGKYLPGLEHARVFLLS